VWGGDPLNAESYKIIKVLNNNVLLAIKVDSKEEMVLVGKGIGFNKRETTIIDLPLEKIEKAYGTYDSKTQGDYIKLIEQLDNDVIGVSEEIISKAESLLGNLNQHIHIALTDHIGFALERIKIGMEINNPFLYEIKTLYAEEFHAGEIAADMILDTLGVKINDSEIGFIALHFHSARQNRKVSETVKNTRILKEIVDIIEFSLDYKISNEGLMYSRLITHLKTALTRLEEHKYIENILLESIKEKFMGSFAIASKIGHYIEENTNMKVSEDELGFMALHIERIKSIKKREAVI
jgi:transcriptional antiterminator